MSNTEEKTKKKSKFKVIDVVYVGVFAALVAVCAQIAVPTTIPFTLQTFAVCLAGGLLGWKRASLSLVTYICLGLVGVPVFSGFKNGVAVVAGPTGGYIIGFLISAFVIGLLVDKFSNAIKNKFLMYVVYMLVGLVASYVFGTIWFMIVYKATLGSALTMCVVPYLLPEVVKVLLAAFLTLKLKPHIKLNK